MQRSTNRVEQECMFVTGGKARGKETTMAVKV
jgi:hypothetical protein